MTDERLYDYSKGLNAPVLDPGNQDKKRGTRLWYFATPMQLSFFDCLYLRLCSDVAIWRIHPGSSRKLTHSISLLLYWYLPL